MHSKYNLFLALSYSIVLWNALSFSGFIAYMLLGLTIHILTQKKQEIFIYILGLGFVVALYFYMYDNSSMVFAHAMLWLILALYVQKRELRNFIALSLLLFMLMLYAATVSYGVRYLVWTALYAAMTLLSIYHYHDSFKREQNTVIYKAPSLKFEMFGIYVLLLLLTMAIYLAIPKPQRFDLSLSMMDDEAYYNDDTWEKEAKNTPGKIDDTMKQITKDLKEEEKQQSLQNQQTKQQEKQDAKPSKAPAYNRLYSDANYKDISLHPKKNIPNLNKIHFYSKAEEPYYLGGRVLDLFDGMVWKTSRHLVKKLSLKNNRIDFGTRRISTKRYEIIPKRNRADKTIYTPSNPASLYFPANTIEVDSYHTFFAYRNLKKDLRYFVDASTIQFKGHMVNSKFGLINKKHFLSLPENFSKKIRHLSQELTLMYSKDWQKAQKIENYLKDEYKYSLQTFYHANDKNPLENFLFVEKFGHCELFASSMALMLRSIGIPAVLREGYNLSTFNPITGYYEARGLDAHVWVEAYIQNQGWIRFEPTSSYSIEVDRDKNTYERYLEKLQEFDALSDDKSKSIQTIFFSLLIKGKATLSVFFSFIQKYILLMTMIVFIILLSWKISRVYLWRSLSKMRLYYFYADDDFILLAHQELLHLLEKVGFEKIDDENITAYKQRLKQKLPQHHEEITFYTDTLEHNFYATHLACDTKKRYYETIKRLMILA